MFSTWSAVLAVGCGNLVPGLQLGWQIMMQVSLLAGRPPHEAAAHSLVSTQSNHCLLLTFGWRAVRCQSSPCLATCMRQPLVLPRAPSRRGLSPTGVPLVQS